jgi:hypothetical protein
MVKTDDMEADRYVVRLVCGHEALEVVGPGESATPVGAGYLCRECNRDQRVIESFRVDP